MRVNPVFDVRSSTDASACSGEPAAPGATVIVVLPRMSVARLGPNVPAMVRRHTTDLVACGDRSQRDGRLILGASLDAVLLFRYDGRFRRPPVRCSG